MATSLLYNSMQTTATKFIEGYTTATTEKNPSLLSTTLSPTCKRYFGPKSILATVGLGSEGLSNAEYEARMSGEIAMLESARAEFQSLVVDEEKRVATTITDHYLQLKGQEDAVCLEFVHLLTFNETGDKIEKVWEFFDTAGALKFIETMMALAKEQQSRS